VALIDQFPAPLNKLAVLKGAAQAPTAATQARICVIDIGGYAFLLHAKGAGEARESCAYYHGGFGRLCQHRRGKSACRKKGSSGGLKLGLVELSSDIEDCREKWGVGHAWRY